MRVLDRYIAWTLALSFVICLAGAVALYVLIDSFERVGDFIDYYRQVDQPGSRASFVRIVLEYYSARVPLIFVQVGPAVMLLASMFTMTRMVRYNELIPLFACGVSLYRVLVPHLAFGALCSVAMMAVQELVLPRLADRIEQAKVVEDNVRRLLDVQVFDSERRVFFFGVIFPFERKMFRARILERHPVTGRRAAEITARVATWTPRGKTLVLSLSHGEVRRFHPDRLSILPGYPLSFGENGYQVETDLTVSRLYRPERQTDVEFFTPAVELARRVREDPRRFELAMSLHLRLSLPLATIVLLALGLPLVVNQETRNFFLGVGICVLVAAAFYATLFVTINLGNKAILNPAFAAWAPLVLFGSLGAAMLDGART